MAEAVDREKQKFLQIITCLTIAVAGETQFLAGLLGFKHFWPWWASALLATANVIFWFRMSDWLETYS